MPLTSLPPVSAKRKPHNYKTSLQWPYMRLTKDIFLYVWIYSWPAVITSVFCC